MDGLGGPMVLIAMAACGGRDIPVGATLSGGQVLVGAISTPTLRLVGALGEVAIPLDDVGMLVPVEGDTLGQSHGNVVVWLRNGSELRGKWEAPELAMELELGGKGVGVEVPTEELQALQLQGAEVWPGEGSFRVRTTHGDDFLVDPAQTRLHLVNALGAFEITLAECLSVGPIGAADGDWTLHLRSGTRLVGKMQEDHLTFALPMGPAEVEVPLVSLVSLASGVWRDGDYAPPIAQADGGGASAAAPPLAAAPARKSGALAESDGWFDNRRLYDAKH